MTILGILADARESLSRLTVNGLCSRDHAEKLVREDALAILDRAIVGIQATTEGDCRYLQTNGMTHWCALAENQSDERISV